MGQEKTVSDKAAQQSTQAHFYVSWRESLQFKITVCFAAVSLAMIIAVISTFQVLVKPTLIEKNRQITEETGARLVTELGKHLEKAETLTQSISDLGEVLPPDEDNYRLLFPQLLGNDNPDSVIAGGGVWPEPYSFNPSIERHSFFWGRNTTGRLEYYDDYNDPTGNGYHHEEWYVPSRYASENQCFWSKSYVDPYSFEPMVTCSVAVRKKKEHVGVVTIDLQLAGLREFLNKASEEINGYVFAVDRNNKFLSFPDLSLVKEKIESPNGALLEDFIMASDLGQAEEHFSPISLALTNLNKKLISNFRSTASYNPLKSIEIARNSYQIDRPEAELIMAMLGDTRWDAPITPATPTRQELRNDILLNEPVYVSTFLIPKTYWKIVVVTPQSIATHDAASFLRQAIIWLLGILLVAATACFLLLRFTLVNPLIKMNRTLNTIQAATPASIPVLPVKTRDELGNLANSINKRTEEIQRINNVLEDEISERRRIQHDLEMAKENAEIANRSKTQFLANMSHELRTPLNAIIGFSELISNGKENNLTLDRSIEYATDIQNSGEHLLELINDILDVARVEVGQMEMREEPVDIKAIFASCIRMMQSQAVKGGLTLDSDTPENIPYLFGDRRQLKQILINLLANAVKFTPEGGTVNLYANYTETNGITLSVSDTGIGIPEKDLARVQEPFTQIENTLAKKHNGTGLGLTISKALAECHGGYLDIQSSLGVGTTITVRFPKERIVGSQGTKIN
ncbi:sensor histidine kinase [Kiloniella majae]|uniref:sensor histidine kinase n=1 Tax=Kiloniella majae TaxID=1938558 RepID=UPI000A27923C|nr:ATP-binding protein [Kiloniella majae]